jgi:hypothetical protein
MVNNLYDSQKLFDDDNTTNISLSLSFLQGLFVYCFSIIRKNKKVSIWKSFQTFYSFHHLMGPRVFLYFFQSLLDAGCVSFSLSTPVKITRVDTKNKNWHTTTVGGLFFSLLCSRLCLACFPSCGSKIPNSVRKNFRYPHAHVRQVTYIEKDTKLWT